MVKITVSNDNFNKLIAAKPGEEIRIEHMNHPGSVVLTKNDFVKQLTIEQIEAELGYHIEIIASKKDASDTIVEPVERMGRCKYELY